MEPYQHQQDQQPPVRRRRSAAVEQQTRRRSQLNPDEQPVHQLRFEEPVAAANETPRKRTRRAGGDHPAVAALQSISADGNVLPPVIPSPASIPQPVEAPVHASSANVPANGLSSESPAAAPVQAQPARPQKTFQYPSQYTSQRAGRTSFAEDQTSQGSEPPPAAPEADASESKESSQKPTLKQKLPYYIGIALCTVVLIVSGTKLVQYYSQIHRANSASGQLRELYRPADGPTATPASSPDSPTIETQSTNPAPSGTDATSQQAAGTEATSEPTATPAQPDVTASSSPSVTDSTADFLAKWPKKYPGNEEMRIQERFTPLRQQNRDVVGWLTIEGVVDEPVFQRNNSYYLTHDATGAQNPTGALFLDENCNLRTVPMQVLIHGHNMKEGAMFGSLKKYKVKDAAFYKEHPFITFDSLYESATYVIFAVAEVNIVPGNTHYFPFWHQFFFNDEEAFRQYVSLAKEYSRFKVDIDIQPGDRLLTLATCSSEDSNLRLIVMARMLRPDENQVTLANQIYSATAK